MELALKIAIIVAIGFLVVLIYVIYDVLTEKRKTDNMKSDDPYLEDLVKRTGIQYKKTDKK